MSGKIITEQQIRIYIKSKLGFYEIRRQLEYKTIQNGCKLLVVDRFFPSSKKCSNCGHVRELFPLSMRQWNCQQCGVAHDRDVNAARNLVAYTASATVNACGGSSSGRMDIPCGEAAPVKQEVNINIYL